MTARVALFSKTEARRRGDDPGYDTDETDERHRVVHGRLSYLQIPAIDVWRSAEFYEKVFGWRIERPYPSFEAPGLIGQWVDDRGPASEVGLMAWIYVEDIGAAFELIRANGGEVVAEPSEDGPTRILATIRDPAGNAIGIWQQAAQTPCARR